MKMMRNLRSSLLRSERKEIIPSLRQQRAWAYAPIAVVFMVLLAVESTTFAGSATWRLDPGEPFCPSCWSLIYPDNWTPATVPNGPADTATFDVSNVTSIFVEEGDIEVNGIVFNAGASAFTISVINFGSFNLSLTISGAGITNNSGVTQNFVVGYPPFPNLFLENDLVFTNGATAGELTVFTVTSSVPHPHSLKFNDDSTADAARVKVFGTGILDISLHNAPGVAVGSIEGSGIVRLGHNNLMVGGNDLTTTFSGVIHGGPGGSLTKVGTGTLKLTGVNTYTNGTTIDGGSLEVSNTSGSGTGSGPVRVAAGKLGGTGNIAGAVTIGTGSGAYAVLAPGAIEGRPGTLAIQSMLTFNPDATYEVGLDTRGVDADQVVADGVTIGNGAFFSFLVRGHAALTTGTVFTVIDNTAATLIAGTFNNLADGSTFTVGSNTFQASYEGGDGNDLTLTVVP